MAMFSFDPSWYAIPNKTTRLSLIITGFTTANPATGDFVTGMFYFVPYGLINLAQPTIRFDHSTYLVPMTAVADVHIPSTTVPTIFEFRGAHDGSGGNIVFSAALRISWA
jgi:hypothetical protein